MVHLRLWILIQQFLIPVHLIQWIPIAAKLVCVVFETNYIHGVVLTKTNKIGLHSTLGSAGYVVWPLCPPDLNPLDFFFNFLFAAHENIGVRIASGQCEVLVARNVVTADRMNTTQGVLEIVRQSFIRMYELCNAMFGTTLAFTLIRFLVLINGFVELVFS